MILDQFIKNHQSTTDYLLHYFRLLVFQRRLKKTCNFLRSESNNNALAAVWQLSLSAY